MCFRCGLIVGKWFVYAVHTINILVTVLFWKTPWGALRRLSDLFIEPTAVFFSLESAYGSIRLEQSGPLRNRLLGLTIEGGEPTLTAREGRFFAPQLGLLVPSLNECRCLPRDPSAFSPT